MRNNSKVLALSGLIMALLSFNTMAEDQSSNVQTAKAPRVMHLHTLSSIQMLQSNLRYRQIDLSNRSLFAQETDKAADDTKLAANVSDNDTLSSAPVVETEAEE